MDDFASLPTDQLLGLAIKEIEFLSPQKDCGCRTCAILRALSTRAKPLPHGPEQIHAAPRVCLIEHRSPLSHEKEKDLQDKLDMLLKLQETLDKHRKTV
jgi:hypothetical protein